MKHALLTALVTIALILSPIASGDAFQGKHLVQGVTSTATAAGTTTLTVSSNHHQRFTGATTQTVVMPDATTMKNGMSFTVSNDSTGVVTVNANGGGGLATLLAGSWGKFVLQSNGSAAGTWDVQEGDGLSVKPVARGGTGASTLTSNNVILGNGTSAVQFVAPGTTGHVLTSNGTTWTSAAPSTASAAPVGSVVMYGGGSAPTGWLLCDGSAVSRTTYSDLFAVVGTTYGVGDGSTTFNLPDARGVFVRGAGTQTISAINYTGTRGTTQGDAMQGHKHSVTDSGHTHGFTGQAIMYNAIPTGGGNSGNKVQFSSTWNSAGSALASDSATTGLTVQDPTTDGTNGTPRTGSETRPANISLSYIIKI